MLNMDYLKLKVQKKNFLLHLKWCEFGYSDKKTQKNSILILAKLLSSPLFKFRNNNDKDIKELY